MKKYGILFMILLFLVLGVVFVHSFSYPYRAKIFPLIIVGLALVLLAVELIKEFLTSGRIVSFSKAHKDMTQMPEAKKSQWNAFLTVFWIASLPIMIWVLGFLIVLPLYTLVYVKTHGEKWLWAISLSLCIFVITYVGFGLLLKIPLYTGLLIRFF